MMQRPLKIITLLVLCGVIALSAAAFGGQGATTAASPAAAKVTAPATVETETAAPLGWLTKALRIQLGIWFGVQIDPPVTRGGKPAVTTPAEDGPAKSQTDPNNPKLWQTLSDNGGEGVY